jgi:hypothetical protein
MTSRLDMEPAAPRIARQGHALLDRARVVLGTLRTQTARPGYALSGRPPDIAGHPEGRAG